MLLQYFLILLMLFSSFEHATNFHASKAQTLSKKISTVVEKVNIPSPLPKIPDREKYAIDTVIDYDHHHMTVEETILYPNHTGHSLESLTLAIPANLWPNSFSLTSLSIDNVVISDYNLNSQRLDVPLPTLLEADSVANLKLRYELSLPSFSDDNHLFGYDDVQTNLVNWYPFVVPNINGEWILHDPGTYGDYLLHPLADFEVNVVFVNPANSPVVASSGIGERIGDFTRYTLTGARSFALSASRDFQVSQMKVGDIKVYSYYLPIYKDAGEAAMFASAQAIQVFSQKFGGFPYPSLSIVLASGNDGAGFSALYFHSRRYYDMYDGTFINNLTYVAIHETARQWWSEAVGTDSALEPWLDQSLSTYSESLYYESTHPELLSYWWANRIDFFRPAGYINIPIYNVQSKEEYKQTVYFNGAYFLRNLRTRIGDEAFFSFLDDYFAQNNGKIATANDFFTILNKHSNVDYSDILKTYFTSQ